MNALESIAPAPFRERLSACISYAGGLRSCAELTGYSDEQIAKWRDGKARPPLFPCAEIARAGGRSLDWLVFGSDAPPTSVAVQTAFARAALDALAALRGTA